jgi:hypothetical protein
VGIAPFVTRTPALRSAFCSLCTHTRKAA